MTPLAPPYRKFKFSYSVAVLLLVSFSSCVKGPENINLNNDKLLLNLTAQETGVHFTNRMVIDSIKNYENSKYVFNGGGVGIGDINNDGLPDLYFGGNLVGDKLYLNLGNFKFKDITTTSGIIQTGWSTSINMVDVNGDGYLDIYVCRSTSNQKENRKNLLYINQKDGTFQEQANHYGIDHSGYSSAAVFFDYDNDNDLDLYLANHPATADEAVFHISYYKKPILKNESDKLYKNVDGEYFVDVTEEAGIKPRQGFGLSVHSLDFNNDGWLDIYVANDFVGEDFLWINNGNGTFSDSLDSYYSKTTFFSMGCDFADLNNDCLIDHFQVDMMPDSNSRIKTNNINLSQEFFNKLHKTISVQYSRNMLFKGNPDNSFSEIGFYADVAKTDWSWSCLAADIDNDGLKDIFVTNGILTDFLHADFVNARIIPGIQKGRRGTDYSDYPNPKLNNYIYKNERETHFSNKSKDWGLDVPVNSNGAAYGDLDNDGDLDLVINNLDTVSFIYRNNSENILDRNYITIQLIGEKPNYFAIGSTVKIYHNETVQVKRQVTTRGFQSSCEPIIHFGLNKDTLIDSIKVHWANGQTQLLNKVRTNQRLVIQQDQSGGLKIAEKQFSKKQEPLFKHTNSIFDTEFTHRESDFNDFKRDKLLHRKISREGPAIAVADVDADGLEDFYIGGAAGSFGVLYLQQSNGTFKPSDDQPWNKDAGYEDTDALFFDANNDGHPDLYLASGSNEFTASSPYQQDRLFINNGMGKFSLGASNLPKMITSTSCIAAADYDNDGDIDLFVGGRIIPGQYPLPPRSYLMENQNSVFKDVTKEIAPDLINPGMVTDAVWADVENDGMKDLVLVGEWMPISIYQNQGNKFINATHKYGMDSTQGWWNAIKAADLDNDGDIDFVAGNHGLNSFFKASTAYPLSIYAGDFDSTGTIKPLLFRYIHGENASFVTLDMLIGEMPKYNHKFLTYSEFAKAGVDELISQEQQKQSYKLYAYELASAKIINKNNKKLILKKLPSEAQLAPLYDFQIEDFTNDDIKDIVAVGNTYSNHYTLGNIDALRGLLLEGTPQGELHAVTSPKAGLLYKGDAKSVESICIKKNCYTKALIIGLNNSNPQILTFNANPKGNLSGTLID